MFIKNKYYRWYMNICQSRQNLVREAPFEKHHIIPKCFGGNNSRENIVVLSSREHFIVHKLLVKCTEGENKRKMTYALWRMCRSSKRYVITSRTFEMVRKEFGKIQSEIKTGSGNPRYGKPGTRLGSITNKETREKQRKAKLKNPVKYWSGKKRTFSAETRAKWSEALRQRWVRKKMVG